ncbi:chemotaxis protein CheW [Lysobacter gummosus]|uniref:Chemotaxis protein CheW n=1 Tax=Lysobacter gummosus TaxID=262324 RepID=A0ABY3XJG9_9GAMM|nr:chemotaxis protein CheW [Lysobacter gummosus]ALN91425.1 cheW-like domain protein [Lysobacter gummosus]UNP31800.1 chemotaxis protein CheW [Lysobacter gummosus]
MNDKPASEAAQSAVARLLGRASEDEELQQAARHIATRADDLRALTGSVFVFRLGGEWLGLPAWMVDEVIEPRPIHSLPHRREGLVRGLVNVRGQLTVCVALESLLQLDLSRPAPERGRNLLSKRLVVLSAREQRLAFESDEVHGSHRYDPTGVGNVPGTVALSDSPFSTGVVAVGERNAGLLDGDLVLSAINRRLG